MEDGLRRLGHPLPTGRGLISFWSTGRHGWHCSRAHVGLNKVATGARRQALIDNSQIALSGPRRRGVVHYEPRASSADAQLTRRRLASKTPAALTPYAPRASSVPLTSSGLRSHRASDGRDISSAADGLLNGLPVQPAPRVQPVRLVRPPRPVARPSFPSSAASSSAPQ